MPPWMDMKNLWKESFQIYFTHSVNKEAAIELIHQPKICMAKEKKNPWVFLLRKRLDKAWGVLEPLMWTDTQVRLESWVYCLCSEGKQSDYTSFPAI